MRRTVPALLALVLLAGCGSSAPTIDVDDPMGTAGDAVGSVGRIVVRDAAITAGDGVAGDQAYEAGEDAPLTFVVVNSGDVPDRLVAVGSPVATSAGVAGDTALPGSAMLLVGGAEVTPVGAAPTATVRATITLEDLRVPLRVGTTYPVTFTFARAGALTLELPVDNPEQRRPTG